MTRNDIKNALLQKKAERLHEVYWVLRVLFEIAVLAQKLHVMVRALAAKNYRENVVKMVVESERLAAACASSALKFEKSFDNIRRKCTAVIGFLCSPILFVYTPCIRPVCPILRSGGFHLLRMIRLPFAKSCEFFFWIVCFTLVVIKRYLFAIRQLIPCLGRSPSFDTLINSFGVWPKTFTMLGLPFFAFRVGLFSIVFLPLRRSSNGTRSTSTTWVSVRAAAIFARFHLNVLTDIGMVCQPSSGLALSACAPAGD